MTRIERATRTHSALDIVGIMSISQPLILFTASSGNEPNCVTPLIFHARGNSTLSGQSAEAFCALSGPRSRR